jgi:xanthine/CO dehydrogenase XdhC/CoxF family maturation factor
MLIAPGGTFTGSLSGGCLEALTARRVLETGTPERIVIDVHPHFGCPGKLDILIEPLSPGSMFMRTPFKSAIRR